MPTFDVTIGGKSYHVEVPDPGGVPLQVIVDGESFEVEIAGTEVWGAPQTTPLTVHSPAPAPHPARTRSAAPPACTEGEEITAPMPGTILSIEV